MNDEKILALAVMARDEASATLTKIDGHLAALGVRAEGTGKQFLSLNASMMGMAGGLAVAAGITAVVGFMDGAVKAAIQLEASTARLTASLKENVPAWDGNTDAINRAVKAAEAKGFTDQQAQESLAHISAATHDVTGAITLQNMAMDLARFRNLDLGEASDKLIKILAGSSRIAKELGINFDKNSTIMERMAEVQKVVGGQSEAFGRTTAGAMARASESIHVFSEEIGTKLMPIVAAAAEWIATKLIPALERLIKVFSDSKPVVDALANAMHLLNPMLSEIDDLQRKAAEAARNDSVSLDGLSASAQQHAHSLETQTLALDANAFAFLADAGAAMKLVQAFELLGTTSTAAQVDMMGAAQTGAGAMDTAAAKHAAHVKAVHDGVTAVGHLGAKYSWLGQHAAAVHHGISAAAKDAAKDIHDAMVAAYEKAKDAGDKYYNSIHQRNQDVINDAHNLARAQIDTAHQVANEQIATATRAVDTQLAQQLRLNAAPVTAAEGALRNIQNQQTARNLQEALKTAQSGVDPIAIRNAQEAIANFQAQLNIENLKAQQAQVDQQARDAAAAAKETLAVTQETENKAYKDRVTAEDERYKQKQHDEDERAKRQLTKFDDHIAALEKADKATKGLANIETLRFLQEQIALAEKYGTAQDVKYARADLAAFQKVPGHAAGIPYVPYDNYLASLHQGERVLTAAENRGNSSSVSIAAGAIVIQGANASPDAIAEKVIYAIQRQMTRNGYTSLVPR